MGRAPCCDKANVKRGPWSPEEDTALKNYVERNGTGGNWIALPHKAGLKRCGKSCRLRWLNYLRPDIKHGGFTEEEDNVICTLYKNIGSRWSVIASHLPGRTDNDVKNYWNTKLKKKLLAGNTNFDTNSINNNHVKLKSSSFSASSSTIVVKDEIPGYIFSGFADSNSQKENSTMRTMEVGYGYNVDSQKFTSEPISFPSTALQNNTGITLTGNGYSGMSISPSDEVSSLAFPLDNSYISWSGNRDRDDEAFLVDFSNGSCFDLLNGYVYQEKLGDPALNFSPNYNYLLTNSDSSLFQSVTY